MNMILSKYKHVIWDWNGTLFNDVELCVSIVNNLLNSKGLPSLSKSEYKNIFTFPVKDYYSSAGFDFTQYSFEELGKTWMDEYEARKLSAGIFNGAAEVLRYLKTKGIGQSILSAYKHDTLLSIVSQFDLFHYFDNVYGLDNIYASSKVSLGKELMSKLQLHEHEVVFLGDTLHDLEVAEAIGADCILIANGHQSKEALSKSTVKILDDITDLLRD
jgi:phosphoglycolate phosphatase